MKFHLLPSILAVFISFVVGLSLGIVNAHKPGDGLAVAVNGNFGGPVTIAVTGSISEGHQRTTLIAGTGPAIAPNAQVLLRVSNFAYTSGGFVSTINSGTVKAATASDEELGDLFSLVKGMKEGSRIVAIYPDKSEVSAEIVVLDLLPTAVRGKMKQPQNFPDGMSVQEDSRGVPRVQATGSQMTDSQVAVLVAGRGEQVKPNEAIYANYLITDANGQVKESTFGQPSVAYIDSNQVFSGLQVAIVDQRVGSRIVAAVPSAQGRGDGDIFVVMDILARADKAPPPRLRIKNPKQRMLRLRSLQP